MGNQIIELLIYLNKVGKIMFCFIDEAARSITRGSEVRQPERHGPCGEGDVGAWAAVPAGGAAAV